MQEGLEGEPLYRVGQALNGAVDRAVAQAVLLLERWLADPTRFLGSLAVIGLACALAVWLLASASSWTHRERRPAPSPVATQLVFGSLGREARARPRRPRSRSRRRGRREGSGLLRWLGRS